jgi:antitoxin MazE
MRRAPESTVQQWGNSLAIRIPASIARSARIRVGQPVEVTVAEDGIHLRPRGEPKTTLAQKLSAFVPELHGGEAMPTGPAGREII